MGRHRCSSLVQGHTSPFLMEYTTTGGAWVGFRPRRWAKISRRCTHRLAIKDVHIPGDVIRLLRPTPPGPAGAEERGAQSAKLHL